jgi:selenocysteine-specific elongation factor
MDIAGRIGQDAAVSSFNPLKLQKLEGRLGVPYPDIKSAVAYLREQEELWLIEGELVFFREARDKFLDETLSSMKDIAVAALRDAAGVNRKLSLAMLDFLDLQGLMRRAAGPATEGYSRGVRGQKAGRRHVYYIQWLRSS